MNIKQVVKFIILSIIIGIVYTFFLGMLVGILGAFLVDMKVSLPMMSLVEQFILVLIIIPAISTSASLVYKKAPAMKEYIAKIALTNTLVTLVISALSLIAISSSPDFYSKVVFMVVDLILTYVATVYFVKKYSNQ